MKIARHKLGMVLTPLVVMAALVVGLWLPHQRQASALHVEIDARKRSLDRARTDIANLINQPRTTLRNESVAMEIAVPPRAELGPLLQQIGEDLATKSLDVDQLQAHTIIEGSDFNRIPITLQCRGTYSALFALLESLETSERLIRVDRIDLTGSPSGDEEGLVTDVEMSAFCRTSQQEGTP